MVSSVKIAVLRHHTSYTFYFKLFTPKLLYPFFPQLQPQKFLRPFLARKLPLPSPKYHCCSKTEVFPDLVVRTLCDCYMYIILSGLYIKRFHTLFVSLYVPIAHYSAFDSMQLITAL